MVPKNFSEETYETVSAAMSKNEDDVINYLMAV